ncbi:MULTISPECIES: TetR/AcrR family transcriptional regulator [unclassified Gordonia (in: high G+C Gram-positive bacteria)]|uniref:TetR/AcrR family transcriptional regulator n=1 Tax=unclassified Gordonia (in: high G+C Gram-positive bacteria) TaxID=2657482 RepID=UPI001FFFF186|nr:MULTISPECIES: TetR/AcrR family transcriptional regulator [unclassified Gordonia (in: high G+C Gram-positive bacteria)]UQE73546.1 TetR/AcrR family transcriptional regulator [Gordonia sp. PP30]
MGNTRTDILAAARGILAEHSLADLTMRRLATEVGVRPNALYWHFPNKQSMLAALADDLLAAVPVPDHLPWDAALRETTRGMRAALLAVPDSAEVVSSAWASGLSGSDLAGRLAGLAATGGLSETAAHGVATALCQLTIGLTIEEQTRAQMERLGVTGPSGRNYDAEFTAALGVILDGARAALAAV